MSNVVEIDKTVQKSSMGSVLCDGEISPTSWDEVTVDD